MASNPYGLVEDGRILIIKRQVLTNFGGFIDLLGLDRDGNVVVVKRCSPTILPVWEIRSTSSVPTRTSTGSPRLPRRIVIFPVSPRARSSRNTTVAGNAYFSSQLSM